MKKALIMLMLLWVATDLFAQTSGLKITFPDNWISFQRHNVIKTIEEKLILSDSLKNEIFSNGTSSQQLYGYTAPNKPGILYRPNIQVLIRKNSTKNNSQFKSAIANSLAGLRSTINDMVIIDSVTNTEIGGRFAVYTKIKGYLNKNGEKAYFNTRIFAIPVGDIFYQITMNDSDDYFFENEFKQVLKSIEF